MLFRNNAFSIIDMRPDGTISIDRNRHDQLMIALVGKESWDRSQDRLKQNQDHSNPIELLRRQSELNFELHRLESDRQHQEHLVRMDAMMEKTYERWEKEDRRYAK